MCFTTHLVPVQTSDFTCCDQDQRQLCCNQIPWLDSFWLLPPLKAQANAVRLIIIDLSWSTVENARNIRLAPLYMHSALTASTQHPALQGNIVNVVSKNAPLLYTCIVPSHAVLYLIYIVNFSG